MTRPLIISDKAGTIIAGLYPLGQMFLRYSLQFSGDLFHRGGKSNLFAESKCHGVRVDMEAAGVDHGTFLRLAHILAFR